MLVRHLLLGVLACLALALLVDDLLHFLIQQIIMTMRIIKPTTPHATAMPMIAPSDKPPLVTSFDFPSEKDQ